MRAYARTMRRREDEIDEVVWDIWDEAVWLEQRLTVATDPWEVLLPIVRHACAATMRRGRREQPIVREFTMASGLEGDESSLCDRVDDLLQQLPEQQRKAVDFRFRWGWPYWAIAAGLETAEVTARVHVGRGLRRLSRLTGRRVR